MNNEILRMTLRGFKKCNKGKHFSLLLVLVFFFSLISFTHAKTIWEIGEEDGFHDEFYDPYLYNTSVFPFAVPADWNLPDKDWKEFTHVLYPPEFTLQPKEIHITGNYLKDYRCPLLQIKVKQSISTTPEGIARESTQDLVVLRRVNGKILEIERKPVPNFFDFRSFKLGEINRNSPDSAIIILQNQTRAGESGKPIYFDFLRLDDQDEDDDWSLDDEEFEGDSDNDGSVDKGDPDTVSLCRKSDDRCFYKIVIDIEEKEEPWPVFKKIGFYDQNSPLFHEKGVPEKSFFPYGIFKTTIGISPEEETIRLTIDYPEVFPMREFYVLAHGEGWKKKEIEVDPDQTNRVLVHLFVEEGVDQGENSAGEGTGRRTISIIGGLAYPSRMDVSPAGDECFIASASYPLYHCAGRRVFFFGQ